MFREGRPLPTVETEVNGDSKSTNESDPSLVSSLDLSDLYERFGSALAALVGPVENCVFLTVHHLIPFVPLTRWACSRAGSPVS
jgi:hypothetical protein